MAGQALRWPKLESEHRRWVLYNAIIGTAVVNAVINAVLAWVTVRGQRSVPVWSAPLVGDPSTVVDPVATLFFLPLFTTVFCTASVRRRLQAGSLEPLAWPHLGFLSRLDGGRFRRGLVLGGFCTAALAPITIAVLLGVDFDGVSRSEFITFKVAFAVALGALVTPLIAVRAMAEAVDGPEPIRTLCAPDGARAATRPVR